MEDTPFDDFYAVLTAANISNGRTGSSKCLNVEISSASFASFASRDTSTAALSSGTQFNLFGRSNLATVVTVWRKQDPEIANLATETAIGIGRCAVQTIARKTETYDQIEIDLFSRIKHSTMFGELHQFLEAIGSPPPNLTSVCLLLRVTNIHRGCP
jgi:hypothetical protein